MSRDKVKILRNVDLDSLFDIYAIPDLPSVPDEDGYRDKFRCALLISRLSADLRELIMRSSTWSDSMFYALDTVVSHLRTLYYLDDDRLE